MPSDVEYERYREFGSAAEQRRQAVKAAGDHPLQYPPGSNFVYSNYGYIITAAMIDRVSGVCYEEAMRQQLFVPLGMTSAVFESPDLVGADHVPRSDNERGQMASADTIRWANPDLLRPAGPVRCTIGDWAKFVLHHLRGQVGRSDYLSAETYRRLHTPMLGEEPPMYASGWHVERPKWAESRMLWHTGSNLLNFARVYVLPEKGYAVLVCSKQNSGKATKEAARVLIEMFTRGDLGVRPQ